jgi:hypothetical protein
MVVGYIVDLLANRKFCHRDPLGNHWCDYDYIATSEPTTGSDRHPRILDDGCCYNVSVFTGRGSRMEQPARRSHGLPLVTKKQKGRRRVEASATAYHTGMIRNPRSMWPFHLNKWLAEWADELGERRYPNDTGGSERGSATQFDLCESNRIIRGLDWRSAYGTLFLPKLCPPSRRALFSMATKARPISTLELPAQDGNCAISEKCQRSC